MRTNASPAVMSANLNKLIRRCRKDIPFYRDHIHEPTQAITTENLARLVPPLSKMHLRNGYPDRMVGVPPAAVRRIHSTSGTSGAPTVVAHTSRDLDVWTFLMGRTLRVAGMRPGDRFYNAYSYGPFTGGQGYHQGASTIPSSCIIPSYGVGIDRHCIALQDFQATVMGCTPHHALALATFAKNQGITFPHLRLIITGSEPFSEALRSELLTSIPSLERVVDVYGFGEAMGPGIAVECGHPAAAGSLHIWDDFFFIEIVDEDLNPVADGVEGEMI